MVQVSTDEVYGSTPEGAFTEESPLQPNNPYSATKAGADLLCRSYHRTYGMDVRIFRGPNAYGPRQHPEKAIPTFTIAALQGRPLPVYGDGSNRREWLHVRDFAGAVLTVTRRGEPGEVYNGGGGHEVTNLDLARTICGLTEASPELIGFVEDRPGHDFRYSMVWDRLRGLGWEPEVPFDRGLEETVAWFREHPGRRGSGG
jgi:dTDP-glucose 4,6-dehydratase